MTITLSRVSQSVQQYTSRRDISTAQVQNPRNNLVYVCIYIYVLASSSSSSLGPVRISAPACTAALRLIVLP
jgi:hypothetical protein